MLRIGDARPVSPAQNGVQVVRDEQKPRIDHSAIHAVVVVGPVTGVRLPVRYECFYCEPTHPLIKIGYDLDLLDVIRIVIRPVHDAEKLIEIRPVILRAIGLLPPSIACISVQVPSAVGPVHIGTHLLVEIALWITAHFLVDKFEVERLEMHETSVVFLSVPGRIVTILPERDALAVGSREITCLEELHSNELKPGVLCIQIHLARPVPRPVAGKVDPHWRRIVLATACSPHPHPALVAHNRTTAIVCNKGAVVLRVRVTVNPREDLVFGPGHDQSVDAFSLRIGFIIDLVVQVGHLPDTGRCRPGPDVASIGGRKVELDDRCIIHGRQGRPEHPVIGIPVIVQAVIRHRND